ncbi:unnamed protein product [Ambrosiozyma monospora]|uniref:Unnamed protein product n=1 Tax=Ambrosiozyma monospora TaxID=43982 RepID=A0ACB5TT04_AMBMO|nr:unnamed protein product [Ambrosiozyma monospora]
MGLKLKFEAKIAEANKSLLADCRHAKIKFSTTLATGHSLSNGLDQSRQLTSVGEFVMNLSNYDYQAHIIQLFEPRYSTLKFYDSIAVPASWVSNLKEHKLSHTELM